MQHPSRPTEPRQEIVDLAAGLVPALAARAAGYDEADAFCHEDFDDLVAAGYTAITVPTELGGRGATALDLVAAQSRLAEGNPATALAVNMHLHGVGLLAEGFRDRVEPFLKQVATEGAVLAGGFSEPQSGGNWWYQASTATPLPGGGYRLSGTKTFFTGWPRATHLFLSAAVETEEGREPIGFLVPRPERGVRVLGDWKAMGMRATGSHALAIDELEIPSECVVAMGFPVAVSFLVGSHWSWPSFASVFLGAAEAAFRHVA
ncbi:MAG: acyl-CoA dehydrogenase family protein, partial [Thermoleophilia bacterium]